MFFFFDFIQLSKAEGTFNKILCLVTKRGSTHALTVQAAAVSLNSTLACGRWTIKPSYFRIFEDGKKTAQPRTLKSLEQSKNEQDPNHSHHHQWLQFLSLQDKGKYQSHPRTVSGSVEHTCIANGKSWYTSNLLLWRERCFSGPSSYQHDLVDQSLLTTKTPS